jgi:hypothetical protein
MVSTTDSDLDIRLTSSRAPSASNAVLHLNLEVVVLKDHSGARRTKCGVENNLKEWAGSPQFLYE